MSKTKRAIRKILHPPTFRSVATPSILYRKTGLALTRHGLLRRAARDLPELSPTELQACLDRIELRTREIVDSDLSWQVPVPSRMHLEWAASVLAAHEVLMELNGDFARSMEIVSAATTLAGRPGRPRLIARRLESALQDDGRGVHAWKIRQAIINSTRHYDSPWEWFLRESDGTRFVVKNPNCFYFWFFEKYQKPELAKVFYRLDKEIVREIRRSRRIDLAPDEFKSQLLGDSENAFTLIKIG